MGKVRHYQSKKQYILLICVIRVNQWEIKLLDTDCDSKGVAINADFTNSTNLIVPVFAGLVSCFSSDRNRLKRLRFYKEVTPSTIPRSSSALKAASQSLYLFS
jgi:hypothetical protein